MCQHPQRGNWRRRVIAEIKVANGFRGIALHLLLIYIVTDLSKISARFQKEMFEFSIFVYRFCYKSQQIIFSRNTQGEATPSTNILHQALM